MICGMQDEKKEREYASVEVEDPVVRRGKRPSVVNRVRSGMSGSTSGSTEMTMFT